MARTKQTARKSCASSAPRKALKLNELMEAREGHGQPSASTAVTQVSLHLPQVSTRIVDAVLSTQLPQASEGSVGSQPNDPAKERAACRGQVHEQQAASVFLDMNSESCWQKPECDHSTVAPSYFLKEGARQVSTTDSSEHGTTPLCTGSALQSTNLPLGCKLCFERELEDLKVVYQLGFVQDVEFEQRSAHVVSLLASCNDKPCTTVANGSASRQQQQHHLQERQLQQQRQQQRQHHNGMTETDHVMTSSQANNVRRSLARSATEDSSRHSLFGQDNCIRLFISSTFKDMVLERQALIENAIPMLRRQLAGLHYEVELIEVDLRWGISFYFQYTNTHTHTHTQYTQYTHTHKTYTLSHTHTHFHYLSLAIHVCMCT